MAEKKSTVSLKNTPVRRALDKAKRSTLLLLFALGLLAGLVYKVYFAERPAAEQPAAATRQQR